MPSSTRENALSVAQSPSSVVHSALNGTDNRLEMLVATSSFVCHNIRMASSVALALQTITSVASTAAANEQEHMQFELRSAFFRGMALEAAWYQ